MERVTKGDVKAGVEFRRSRAAFMDEARGSIRQAIEQHGAYSHNIVGLVLARVARDLGYAAANELVREFKNPYGIREVRE